MWHFLQMACLIICSNIFPGINIKLIFFPSYMNCSLGCIFYSLFQILIPPSIHFYPSPCVTLHIFVALVIHCILFQAAPAPSFLLSREFLLCSLNIAGT